MNFTKEYLSYLLVKKKPDRLFNKKKDFKESLPLHMKRFKTEKAKIVGYNDIIARSVFRKGLLADHPIFRELIMGDDLTMADSYALVKKHSLYNEAKHSQKVPQQPWKYLKAYKKKTSEKQLNNKSNLRSKCVDRSLAK